MQAPLLLRISAELRATFDNMTVDAHGTNRHTSSRPVFGGGALLRAAVAGVVFFQLQCWR
jgi:hypothetical protein